MNLYSRINIEELIVNVTLVNNKLSRGSVDATYCLTGKHYETESDKRRKSTYVYKVNPEFGKQHDTKTNIYCRKCNVLLWRNSFPLLHSKRVYIS